MVRIKILNFYYTSLRKRGLSIKMNHNTALTNISFFDYWSPLVILLTAAAAVLYLLAVGPYRNRFGDAPPVGSGKKFLFLCGLFALYFAVGGPLNFYGHHYLFSAHIMQQSLLFFVVPPLLLLGTPDWLIRPLFEKDFVRKTVRVTSHPGFAIFTFNFALTVYHVPAVFDTMMDNPVYGFLYHVFLTMAAFQMWWLITCPIPELERLSGLKKLGYIVVNGLLLYPVCALIIFAKQPIYDHYLNAPQILWFLKNTQQDQQLGGVIMKLMQEGALIMALGYAFRRWYREENRKEEVAESYSVPSASP